MTYTELFAASNGTFSNGTVEEIGFNTMRANNEKLLGELNNLNLAIEQYEATATNLDALALAGEHLGAPKTDAEKLLFAVGVVASFGGKVPVKQITGYSMEDMSEEDSFGYAMESLKSRAASVYAWIREQIMKVYDIIEAFFYNLAGGIPSARSKAKKMRARAEAASGKAMEEKTFEISKQVASVLSDAAGAKPKDLSGLSTVVEKLGETIEILDNKYYSLLSGYAKELEIAISDFEVTDAETGLKAINALFSSKAPAKALFDAASENDPLFIKGGTSIVKGDTRYANKTVKRVPLFSGKSIFFAHNELTKNDETPPVTKAEAYYSTCGEVRDTSTKLPKIDSTSVSTLSLSEVEKLADAIEKACDQIEGVSRGVSKGNIKKDKAKLDRSAKKLDGALEKAKNESGTDKLSGDNVTCSRLALKMTKQYADMVAKPVPQVISITTTLINQALVIGNKSIGLHK